MRWAAAFGTVPARMARFTVVGMVEDGRYVSLTEEPRAVVFWPTRQFYLASTTVVARSARPDAHLAERMRSVIERLDPSLPVFDVGGLGDSVNAAYLPAKAATIFLIVFGVLVLMLALTGVYGLASYLVSRRVREIGVRVALGAGRGQVLRSVLGRMVWLVGAGLVVGTVAGIAASRLLANIVYQATPRDPLVLGGVLPTMVAAALAAGLGPARRVLSLDPWRILRHE